MERLSVIHLQEHSLAKLIDGKSMHSFNLNSFLCDDGDASHDHDNDEHGQDNDNSDNEQYQTSIYTTPKLFKFLCVHYKAIQLFA